MKTTDPKTLVLAYHEAFYDKNRAAVRALLADEGQFIGPLSAFTNPDTFLDAASVFMRIAKKPNVKCVIAEGADVCVVYDYLSTIPMIPPIPSVAWFRTEGGKIKVFHVHFDPAAIVLAMERGELGDGAAAQKREAR